MSWMTILWIVLGVVGYILAGGIVVRIFAEHVYDHEEAQHYGWFRRIFFTPSVRMGLLWPVSVVSFLLSVFVLLLFFAVSIARWVLYGFKHPPMKGVRVVLREKRR